MKRSCRLIWRTAGAGANSEKGPSPDATVLPYRFVAMFLEPAQRIRDVVACPGGGLPSG
jgi:hypothetical protein